MPTLRLALAQCNCVVGDLAGNRRRMLAMLADAEHAGADLLLFPELAIAGYPPEDLLLKPSFLKACRAELEGIAARSARTAVLAGFPELAGGRVHNSAALMGEGRIQAVARKMFLPNYGVFDEKRYFSPGAAPLLWQSASLRVGVTICEDIWQPAGPQLAQVAAGADLIVNISASPFARGKGDMRERMLATRASDSQVALAFCNLVGGQDELVFDGRSAVFLPNGEVLARAREFHEELLIVDLDLNAVSRQRLQDPRSRDSLWSGSLPECERVAWDLLPPAPRTPARSAPKADVLADVAAVYSALVLGTRDYVEKNGFAEVVLGLSGGVDSALVATIAADALGAARVHAVSMPSRYSSGHSRDDAADLAGRLGLDYRTLPIEPVIGAFQEVLRPSFDGRPSGLAEENLQARVRGTLLMALSNKFGWLVLTTGNKSEMSTGYATLYGDMAGGFAVIKDVPKTLVYRLCAYRNAIAPVIPENTLTKPPSAELRPDQKDSDSLPDYEILDPILHRYIEQDYSLGELCADAAEAVAVVGLVDRAEYKRRQAPPGVKITARAFGRDRRLPITNRFREETSA